MNSSAWLGRKIASNLLFTGGELLSDPLVTVGAEGEILAVEQCTAPDRCAGVEFYAGILIPGLVDACCGLLTSGAALRHWNAGTVIVGYPASAEQTSPIHGLLCRPLGSEFVFLSEAAPLPENKVVLIDRPLTPQDVDRLAEYARSWCLCPAAVGVDGLPETLALLRQYRIIPALGSYGNPEVTSLAEILHLLAGEPVADVLAWATVQGARVLGINDRTGEILPGRRCGLNVLSGLDYQAMHLTAQMRLTRIV